MYVCMCMYVFLHVSVNVYMYVCMYVYMYVCSVYVYMYVYVWTFVCMYVCMYPTAICIRCEHICRRSLWLYQYVRLLVNVHTIQFLWMWRQAIYVWRNIVTRSCSHCNRGKAISITYSDRKCAFLAIGIQIAMCVRHIVIYGLRSSTIFFHIS